MMNPACDPRSSIRPPLHLLDKIHVTHLPLKVDGQTEHAFIAVLNNEAIGSAMAKLADWGACSLRQMFVSPRHRHKGAGTQILRAVERWAVSEKALAVEIAVHKGNAEARKWWINRKFSDMGDERQSVPDYVCMVRPL